MQIKEVAAVTDNGVKREVNEDAVLNLSRVPVFAIADGMGGKGIGDVAARTALDVVKANAQHFKDQGAKLDKDRSSTSRLGMGRIVESTFQWAHMEVQQEASQRGASPMATTMVLATIAGSQAYIGHVGDSRAYLVRDGELQRLTEDHTVAMAHYRQGRITKEELRSSQDRHRLYQALGVGTDVDVSTAELDLADDDILMLCSDGLTRVLSDKGILKHFKADQSLGNTAKRLVAAANRGGGPDNISIVLVRVGSERKSAVVNEVANIMRAVFLFSKLSEPERMVIAPYLDEMTLSKGEFLCREGDEASEFYLIVEGAMRITRGGTHLVDIGPGGHLGELALARPNQRSATVVALEPSLLYSLSRERFNEVMMRRPGVGAKLSIALLDTVGDRLRDLTARLSAVESAARGDLLIPGTSRMDVVLRAVRGEIKED